MNAKQRAAFSNGCGPKCLPGWLVPDTMWGLDISEACDIHDYMYATGVTQFDKDLADMWFLRNLQTIIRTETSRWNPLFWLRMHRARVYYVAVRDFGESAFWASKGGKDAT